MKNLYTIYYNKPHNPHHRKFRNQVRDIAFHTVNGADAAKAFIAEVEAHGLMVTAIYNGIGNKVSF